MTKIIRSMRSAFRISKVTNTHLEYVIIAFRRQNWFRENRLKYFIYAYVRSLVCFVLDAAHIASVQVSCLPRDSLDIIGQNFLSLRL